MKKMNIKIVDIKDYDKVENYYKFKGEHPSNSYTTNNGLPLYINKRIGGYYGYCDNDGIEWKVEFNSLNSHSK